MIPAAAGMARTLRMGVVTPGKFDRYSDYHNRPDGFSNRSAGLSTLPVAASGPWAEPNMVL